MKPPAAANTIVVKTVDGVEHSFHYTKDLLFHGGKSSGVDALQGLRDGTTVAVHYTSGGPDPAAVEIDQISDNGLSVTEGMVARIDRGRKQITIGFDSGTAEVKSGEVDSEADKTMAGMKANGVSGSFGVENELTVEKGK